MAEIDDYLARLDEEDATIIGDAYASARSLVSEVEEGMSYGMPALILQGRALLSIMRAKGTSVSIRSAPWSWPRYSRHSGRSTDSPQPKARCACRSEPRSRRS